jgi:hypothetical protein
MAGFNQLACPVMRGAARLIGLVPPRLSFPLGKQQPTRLEPEFTGSPEGFDPFCARRQIPGFFQSLLGYIPSVVGLHFSVAGFGLLSVHWRCPLGFEAAAILSAAAAAGADFSRRCFQRIFPPCGIFATVLWARVAYCCGWNA